MKGIRTIDFHKVSYHSSLEGVRISPFIGSPTEKERGKMDRVARLEKKTGHIQLNMNFR